MCRSISGNMRARMSGTAGGMFFSDVDASGHEAAAEEYLRLVAARLAETRRHGYELLGVSEGWSVLDVGCGLGEVCADLSEIVGARGRVVGIDASSALVAKAREQWSHLPIEFGVGDAEALDFGDATFDAVRAERVLQHLDRPATAIGEMARVVRPGGRISVFDTVQDSTVVATEHPAVWRAVVARAL